MSALRNKQRLLHLYRYLIENTDEDHQVTTNDLVVYLKQKDANASRKTVKDDIEVLTQEGIDIVTTKSYYNSYFIGERMFEIPEIRFLVDSIAANASTTVEKKQKMIGKLLSVLSKYQAEKIRKSVFSHRDHGTSGEQFYYSIDRIAEAISDKRKIEFQLYEYNSAREKVLKNGGEVYVITPVIMTSDHSRYYMLGYNGAGRAVETIRIDRMSRIKVLETEADAIPANMDIDKLLNGLFEMKTGNMAEVILECDNDMMDTIVDRFGINADIWKSTQDKFYVKQIVSVSPAFYAWIFSRGNSIRIISPIYVLNGYRNMLRSALRGGEVK